MLYILKTRGQVLGVFDSSDEAKGFVPEADTWTAGETPGALNGWRPDRSFYDEGPDYTITTSN